MESLIVILVIVGLLAVFAYNISCCRKAKENGDPLHIYVRNKYVDSQLKMDISFLFLSPAFAIISIFKIDSLY